MHSSGCSFTSASSSRLDFEELLLLALGVVGVSVLAASMLSALRGESGVVARSKFPGARAVGARAVAMGTKHILTAMPVFVHVLWVKWLKQSFAVSQLFSMKITCPGPTILQPTLTLPREACLSIISRHFSLQSSCGMPVTSTEGRKASDAAPSSDLLPRATILCSADCLRLVGVLNAESISSMSLSDMWAQVCILKRLAVEGLPEHQCQSLELKILRLQIQDAPDVGANPKVSDVV
mmetsp:Transcript_3663/g.6465  ORF Transcript_3663/g.6465 Transcript_3663/m.6465 type:complete len:237 (-) Transcript_3663:45-755(-)